jgi:TetR/AcrR family transcriptional regulator
MPPSDNAPPKRSAPLTHRAPPEAPLNHRAPPEAPLTHRAPPEAPLTHRAPPEAPLKRRVGRPRKQADATLGEDLRAQIVASAAELFRRRGIGDVSMHEIAQSVGLGTSSLYYWFRRKELIVAELLQQINRLPLAQADALAQVPGSADVQLYALVRFDVRMICEFPLEITEVHRFSERDPDAFATYWQERGELAQAFERIVQRGIQAGLFRKVDATLCALTIIAQDESVQNWRRAGLSGGVRDAEELGVNAEAVADFVASQTVGGLIADPARLDAIRERARG